MAAGGFVVRGTWRDGDLRWLGLILAVLSASLMIGLVVLLLG